MKQSLMLLTGITYNYYDRKNNFALLVFLDEEKGIFTGIEVQDPKDDFSDLDKVKSHLTGFGFVSGLKREKFQYLTLDPKQGQIRMSDMIEMKDSSKYSGSENIIYSEEKRVHQNSSLKFCDSGSYVSDEELEAFVSVALASQDGNIVFRNICRQVEELADIEQRKAKGYLKVDGNVSDR